MVSSGNDITFNIFGVLFWIVIFAGILFFVLSDEVTKVIDEGIVPQSPDQQGFYPPVPNDSDNDGIIDDFDDNVTPPGPEDDGEGPSEGGGGSGGGDDGGGGDSGGDDGGSDDGDGGDDGDDGDDGSSPGCGNNICESNESCATCSEDCGECPPDTSCSDVGGFCQAACGSGFQHFGGGDEECTPLFCCVPENQQSNFFLDDYDNTFYIEELVNARQDASYIEPIGSSGGGEIDPNGSLGAGLLSLWHLNDNLKGNGQTVRDSKGNWNGTLVADADCTIGGQFGGGCKLDGLGDFIELGADGDIVENVGAFTVSFWAKNNVTDFASGNWYLDKTGGGNDTFEVFIGSNERVSFRVYTANGSPAAGANAQATINDTQWHNIVGVYDGSKVKLYIDGVLNSNAPSLTGNTLSTTNALNIGARSIGTVGFYNGVLDDVAVWNRALSEPEVISLSQQARVEGSFSSKNILTNADIYSLIVAWSESGSGVNLEVSTNGGITWCSMDNGKNLNNSSCNLPVSSFKYRVNFDAQTRMERVRFDWSTDAPVCGNNEIDGAEVCDGTDLGEQTCQTLGYESGNLSCQSNCLAFNTDSCNPYPPPPAQSFFVDGQLLQNCLAGNYSIANHDCSGSDGVAYKHPQEAAEIVNPGDTVLIRGGTYKTHARSFGGTNVIWLKRSGQSGRSILFRPYGNESVVFDGENKGITVYLDGQGVSGGLNYIELVGLEIINGRKGVVLRQGKGLLLEGNKIHEIVGTNRNEGAAVEIIEQGGNDQSPYPEYGYHVIRKNEIYNDFRGIHNRGSHTLIEYNHVYNALNLYEVGNGDCIGSAADYVTLRYNVIHDCGDDGVDLSRGQVYEGWTRGPWYNIFEYNVVYNNGKCYNGDCGDGSGLKTGTYDSGLVTGGGAYIIRYNVAFGNDLRGIESAGNYRRSGNDPATPPEVHYGNIAFGNSEDGYYAESADIILMNNISYNTGNGPFRDARLRGYIRDINSNFNLWGDRWLKDELDNLLGDGVPPEEPLWWDQQSIDSDPLFVDPLNPQVVTDISLPNFGDALGFHVLPNSTTIDKGTDVRKELEWLLQEINTTNQRDVNADNWRQTLNFALQNIPNPFPYNGSSPDIGGIYENR